jgi:Protein of unknown function (DUF3618)
MARESDRLEWEAERARDELAASLDQLRGRLTGRQIVDEAVSYLRETPVAEFGRNVLRDLREHPLPLLVIFAGVAWAILASALADRKRVQRTLASPGEPPPTEIGTSSNWTLDRSSAPQHRDWAVAPVSERIE